MAKPEELNEIREALKEARRYVRTDVVHTRDAVLASRSKLVDIQQREFDRSLSDRLDRLIWNLERGVIYIQVNPSVLEGYIDGAVFELSLRER